MISGLFMTSRSKIELNISSVIRRGDFYMYLKCNAKIYISTWGCDDISPITSFRRTRNYYFRHDLSYTDLVSIRSNCKYLSEGKSSVQFFSMSSTRDFDYWRGKLWPRYLMIKLSINFVSSGLFLMAFESKMLIRSFNSFFSLSMFVVKSSNKLIFK